MLTFFWQRRAEYWENQYDILKAKITEEELKQAVAVVKAANELSCATNISTRDAARMILDTIKVIRNSK